MGFGNDFVRFGLIGGLRVKMKRMGEAKLSEELKKLQVLLNQGYDLKVVWTPKKDSNLDGEVKGNTIHVYSQSLEEALKTLRHEFLDYAVSQCVEPYKQVANQLIAIVNKQAYERKEKLVESLASLLSSCISRELG